MEDKMLFPVTCLSPGIFIPERLMQMHPAEHQNVRPAVVIEIMNVTEHGIARTRFGGKCFRRVKLMLVREAGADVPERPGHDIHFTVTIDVTRRDAITIILVGESLFPKLGADSGCQREEEN